MYDVVWASFHFAIEVWVTLYPYQSIKLYHVLSQYGSLLNKLFYFFRLYYGHGRIFPSLVDIDMGPDVLSTVVGSFMYFTNTMMSSGL